MQQLVETSLSSEATFALAVPTPAIPSVRIESRELLESIVAQALRALGFAVQTNAKKLARRGASIKVDVWAEKCASDTRFKVYVSCKN